MSYESWWLYALLREETVILPFFGTQTHMASANNYSCINDDILVLTLCLDPHLN